VDFHRSDSEGALCARLVSSFPSSRWEDWRLVHLCCFGGAVTRLLEHSRVQTYESPWMACWLLALTWTVQPKNFLTAGLPHDATWSKPLYR
jgi:hypothetical protein